MFEIKVRRNIVFVVLYMFPEKKIQAALSNMISFIQKDKAKTEINNSVGGNFL